MTEPKVKKLEWKDLNRGRIIAGTPFYAYEVSSTGCLEVWIAPGFRGLEIDYESVDAAKAAAQEHFEKRVLECLE